MPHWEELWPNHVFCLYAVCISRAVRLHFAGKLCFHRSSSTSSSFFFTRKSQSSVGILQARLLHVKPSCSAIWNILWEDKRLLRPEKKLRLCHTAPPSFLSFSGKVRIDGLEYRRRLAAETTLLPAPLSSVRGLCALGPCQTWERQATLREATFLKAVRKNNIGQGSPRCRARDI